MTHIRGPLVEETHYYPLGLTMVGISDKALKASYDENKYKYNGIEYDSTLGLDEYEAHFRNLDPQTGRWWQIDPKIDAGYENQSPYASMYDDPERYSDPLGDEGNDCCKELWDKIKTVASTVVVAGNLVVADPLQRSTAKTTELLRQAVISAGSTLNGQVNSASYGAWPIDPAGAFIGTPTETNPVATTVGQAASLPVPFISETPNMNAALAVADGTGGNLAANSTIVPALPSVKVDASSNNDKSEKPNTLKPGPYATESIPARGKGRNFTQTERNQVNAIGNASGCHSCGSPTPKTTSGNWVLDHQPVSATVPDGTDQYLFPQCLSCSQSQGGTVSQLPK